MLVQDHLPIVQGIQNCYFRPRKPDEIYYEEEKQIVHAHTKVKCERVGDQDQIHVGKIFRVLRRSPDGEFVVDLPPEEGLWKQYPMVVAQISDMQFIKDVRQLSDEAVNAAGFKNLRVFLEDWQRFFSSPTKITYEGWRIWFELASKSKREQS